MDEIHSISHIISEKSHINLFRILNRTNKKVDYRFSNEPITVITMKNKHATITDILSILSLNEQLCDAILKDNREKIMELKLEFRKMNAINTKILYDQ